MLWYGPKLAVTNNIFAVHVKSIFRCYMRITCNNSFITWTIIGILHFDLICNYNKYNEYLSKSYMLLVSTFHWIKRPVNKNRRRSISINNLEVWPIDLSTARPKWRLDGPALSGHLLYSLVNHAYANRYNCHLADNWSVVL